MRHLYTADMLLIVGASGAWLFLRSLADDPGWIPGDNGIGLYVFGDHTASANNSVFAYRNAA